MEIPSNKLCMGCMGKREEDGVCPACGFDPTAPHHPLYLRAGTLITKRYIAGKLLGYNGEGANYLGYDLALNKKVIIREYMPDVLAVREKGGINVLVLKGKETQYKALLSDFCELNRSLQKLRSYVGIVSVLDFFEMNSTAYAIYDDCGETTLSAYIAQNGPMPWQTLRDALAAPLAAVEAMHTMGMYHRGISPETIFVNENGAFKLDGFSIAAARTAKSELAAELFSGYSPPELYSLTGWQGSWTDVYSIAAVCYYALTGQNLPDAAQRQTLDPLKQAHQVLDTVPLVVSDALMAALALEPRVRVQSIGDLTQALASIQPAQPIPDVDTEKDNQSGDAKPQHSETRGETMHKEQMTPKKQQRIIKRKIRNRSLIYMLSSMFITTAILLTLMFVILSEIDSSMLVFAKEPGVASAPVSDVSSEEEAPTTYYLPNFVGSYLETVKRSEDYMVRYAVTDNEEFNEEYPAGVIFEQNPPSGTIANELVNVAVKVSKGPAPIPENIVGMYQSEAESMLKELKISYRIAEAYDDFYPAGQVISYTRMPGEILLKVSLGSMGGGGGWNGDQNGEYDGMTWEELQKFLYG